MNDDLTPHGPALDLDAEESERLLGVLLGEHAERSAERAVARLGGPLQPENLDRFLSDEACVRLPTDIVYSDEGLEAQQFAGVRVDEEPGRACHLQVRPRFRSRPEILPVLVGYMIPVINYGDIVSPELCETYGATLLHMDRDEYYRALCSAADG